MFVYHFLYTRSVGGGGGGGEILIAFQLTLTHSLIYLFRNNLAKHFIELGV